MVIFGTYHLYQDQDTNHLFRVFGTFWVHNLKVVVIEVIYTNYNNCYAIIVQKLFFLVSSLKARY